MNVRTSLVAAGVSLSLTIGLSSYIFVNGDSRLEERSVRGSVANVRTLETAYDRWAAAYRLSGADQQLVLTLVYSKGLSAEFTRAHGQAKFDLMDGSVSVAVSGLPEEVTYDVWLIDNRPGPGHSVKPEPGDALVRLGSLQHAADTATLRADLAEVIDPGFKIDLVTITRGGEDPGQGGLLFGSPSLFQKLYYNQPGGAFAALGDVATPIGSEPEQLALWTLPFRAFVPSPASAQGMGGDPALDPLVVKGRDIFFNETFDGNGRTCGTCHAETNNFTIDPAFIATLPDDDPLFVAEFNPRLKKNFEKPALMREFGLILENQDGFGDLKNNFNMRGTPHTLALQVSVDDNETARLGWGGDASPSVRDFAIGAIRQHFPKSLDRVAGVDFRFPTVEELDFMEAFQLSLGRQEDLDLDNLDLKGTVPKRGLEIFLDNDVGKCNICHLNAGANFAFGGGNGNFDTGVEDLPDQPARLADPSVPLDDGFGAPGDDLNGTFNTPPLVEAADTGPFFHNNSVETIEGAVAFYNGDAFNNSPAVDIEGVGEINLDATQVVAVAAFLRVINALENIESAIAKADRALDIDPSDEQLDLLELARVETADAIDVLRGGGLHPDAVLILEEAVEHLHKASTAKTSRKAQQAINTAIDAHEDAREVMVDE